MKYICYDLVCRVRQRVSEIEICVYFRRLGVSERREGERGCFYCT
jgi:hypothetical protein